MCTYENNLCTQGGKNHPAGLEGLCSYMWSYFSNVILVKRVISVSLYIAKPGLQIKGTIHQDARSLVDIAVYKKRLWPHRKLVWPAEEVSPTSATSGEKWVLQPLTRLSSINYIFGTWCYALHLDKLICYFKDLLTKLVGSSNLHPELCKQLTLSSEKAVKKSQEKVCVPFF